MLVHTVRVKHNKKEPLWIPNKLPLISLCLRPGKYL